MSKYHKAFQGFVKVFTGAAKPGVKGNPTTIVGVAPSKNIKKFQEQKEKIIKTTDAYKKKVNDPEVKKKMNETTSKTLGKISQILKGKKVADNVSAIVVPGSGLVKAQAEEEGLDKIYMEAGFEWREPGCSMCLAMNAYKLKPQERCASTSNRNFEGRQGRGGRTHLVSPGMAIAAAISGHLADVRKIQ